jgi:hypothetical protein
MITFTVPNLDDASTDPEDYRELAQVLAILNVYALCKAEAMRKRLAGRIVAAADLDAENERRYKWLPKWAQW